MDHGNGVVAALLNEFQVAELLGVSVDTIRRWRREGVGVPFVKLGATRRALVRYRPADVADYIKGNVHRSTSERAEQRNRTAPESGAS